MIEEQEKVPDLFPYQIEGAEFLVKNARALLADSCGLGKTVQVITACDRLNLKRILVICPAVAKVNWLREFEFWSDHARSCQILQKLSDTIAPEYEIVICSFNYAHSSLKYLVSSQKWDVLVVDEAHFLKTPKAKRTKAILGRNGLASCAKRIWLLSGTPAPNHAGELWVPLRTFGITLLTYEKFIEYFCHTRRTEYGLQVMGSNMKRVPELKQLLKQCMLRRLKKDVMQQLPKLSYGFVYVEPAAVVLSTKQSFLKYFYPIDDRECLRKELKSQLAQINMLYKGMRVENEKSLQAIEAISDSVSTARRFMGLQKVQPTIDLVSKELDAGLYKKIVIFCLHRDVIEDLRIGLAKYNPVTLYGGTPPKKRQKNIDRFQNTHKYQIFIGNIHAAGTAITLTRAHHVLFVEQDWVPGANAQAVMRVHRIGQENPVSCRFMALHDTLDAKIMKMVKKKTQELTEIFD